MYERQKKAVEGLQFCKVLMDKLLKTAKAEGGYFKPNVVQEDIRRLRSELNLVAKVQRDWWRKNGD